MNGSPLTPNHGFPVRALVPGVAGARSVKWLDRITVQLSESPNFYQQHDYKALPYHATDSEAAKPFWHRVPALQDMPVNSVVADPGDGETVRRDAQGRIEVRGYALPSGDHGPVVRVEVSGDGGVTWEEAELLRQEGGEEEGGKEGVGLKWAWTLWWARVGVEKGTGRILSRATDRGGNVQDGKPEWNLRGVAYNGYGEARGLTVL